MPEPQNTLRTRPCHIVPCACLRPPPKAAAMPTAPSERNDLRRRIAALAARMIAEDGIKFLQTINFGANAKTGSLLMAAE